MQNRIYINVENVILYLENFSFQFQPIILQNIFIEDYKNQYGKTYEEDKENLKRLAKNRLDIIKDIKPEGKILDLGSAMGFFLKEASLNGYKTEGIEISEYAANYCVSNLNLNVHNISLLDFEYKKKNTI